MKHWVKHFAEPIPIVAPIMILEIVIRPLSLCMRLFGNMLAGFVVMELLKAVVPTDCTDSGQFLFRYFRWPSSGVRICIPDIFIHDGRDGVDVIRLEYQTGKIRDHVNNF